ncbi:MAG: SGNH/GDSL hydrolase family protein [Elusimicrobia bacterium]|nr:SGNH/GDSL hydrolase family protein [Elusimicrobiota bacterium]
MNREAAKGLLAAAISCAAAAALLAALEIGARWKVGRIPRETVPSGREVPPYFNNPGVVTSPRALALHIEYRINSLGLRGPEIPLRKPAGRRRVLLLGDSVVFGALVPEAETLSARLEAFLRRGGDASWEVLNGGARGYDIWDYEAFLRLKGLALEPDIVAVGLFMNDHVGRKEYQTHADKKSSPRRPLFSWLRDVAFKSELARACNYFIQRHQRPKRPLFSVPKPLTQADRAALAAYFPADPSTARAAERYLEEYRYDPGLLKDALPWMLDAQAWEKIRAPLSRMKALCARRGIRLLVIVFPTQYEVFPGYGWPQPHRRIARIVGELHLPMLDLKPVFADGGGDELYEMRYDYDHPNGRAYELAARALEKYLEKLGWIGDKHGA